MDSAIQWINHYPLNISIGFASVYPVDSAIHRLKNWGLIFNFFRGMMASGDEEVAAQAVPTLSSCSSVDSVPPVPIYVPLESPVNAEVTVP